MSFWKLAIRAAADEKAKLAATLAPKRAVQDTSLPLGGHIGGYVKVDKAALFAASMLGSFVVPPETGECVIAAISRVRLDDWPESLGVYRYYLATGDDGGKERYVQAMVRDGKLVEAVYYTSLTRLITGDPEVQKYYSGELDKEGIGDREWVFPRSDLEGMLTAEQFATLGKDVEGITWQRAIGDGDFHLPLHGVETRIDDSVGIRGISQEVWCMPHVRPLEGGLVEHLFISLEVVKSHDGKQEDDVHVDFMVGMPLALTDFQII